MDYLNVRDDIETISGVKIPASRSDMSISSETFLSSRPERYVEDWGLLESIVEETGHDQESQIVLCSFYCA